MPQSARDDQEIVRAVLDGDTDQFAVLVRRYHGPLLRLAENRLAQRDVAEDAVQDAFLAAYRSLSTYKPQFQFRTWLWTILLNQCRRHHGRAVRRNSHSLLAVDADDLPADSAQQPPPVVAMLRERNDLLQELMLQLPEVQADAIRLRFFGGLKYREIADAMQSSLSSAKQRVRHGLTTMSDLLRERELSDSLRPGEPS